MARTAKATAQYRERRALGVCVQCGGESGGRVNCPGHRTRNIALAKAIQADHIATGLCRLCPRPVLVGRTMCTVHLANMSARVSGHGATVEDRTSLFAKQDGGCAICNNALQDAFTGHVDHSHGTGKIRGMLCKRCNATVGLLENRPWYVDACERYIDEFAA